MLNKVKGGRRSAFPSYISRNCCETYFSVILSEAKDLELIEKTRFFATLRMTKFPNQEFCNGW